MTARIAAAAWTRLEIDANSASLLLESALVRGCGTAMIEQGDQSLLKALRCDHSSGCGLEVSLEAEHWQTMVFKKKRAGLLKHMSSSVFSPPVQPPDLVRWLDAVQEL